MGKYGVRTVEQIENHVRLMQEDINRVTGQIERSEVGPDATWAYEKLDRFKAELADLQVELSEAQQRSG